MVKADRVLGHVIGANSSVMHGIDDRDRNRLLEFIEDGMTLDQAIDRIANEIAIRVGRSIGIQPDANPFSST